MLQIAGNTRSARLLSAIEKLNIRFPVAEIAKKTGLSKPTVSRNLKSKDPSRNFIKTFSQHFAIDWEKIWNGPDLVIRNGDDLTVFEIKTPDLRSGVDWEKEYWKLKEQFDKLYEKVTFVKFNSDGELETIAEDQPSLSEKSQILPQGSVAGKTGVFRIKDKKKKDKKSERDR